MKLSRAELRCKREAHSHLHFHVHNIGATVSWRNDTYLVQSRVGCLPAKVASYAGTSTSKQEASALPGRCEPMDSVWLGGV